MMLSELRALTVLSDEINTSNTGPELIPPAHNSINLIVSHLYHCIRSLWHSKDWRLISIS